MPTPDSGGLSEQQAFVDETLVGILTEVYSIYNPDKLAVLDTMVETFKGRERDLIVSLCDKYDLDQKAYLHDWRSTC